MKTATHLRKRRKSIAPATQNDFDTLQNTSECHKVPRLYHAKRSNETLETSKMTPPAELTIGTAIRGSHERLRTVANGCERCERLRTVATVANGCERLRTETQRRANTLSAPRPRVKREPLLRIREE